MTTTATSKGTIAILTGGGDVPGLNPAIRAITIRALREGYHVIGIRRGWAGVVDYVQMYVAPVWLGADGVPMFAGRDVTTAALIERRVELLGPDVLIEGYVHRPH